MLVAWPMGKRKTKIKLHRETLLNLGELANVRGGKQNTLRTEEGRYSGCPTCGSGPPVGGA
jgi:hypothetical protein